MSSSLPLPKGFFDTNVRISEESRRKYIDYAEASIKKVFALSDCHKNSWIPVSEKKGVAVYRNFIKKRGPTAYRSNVAEVGCKGKMNCTLEEIARTYATHNDALFRRLTKKLNPSVLDAMVLYSIVPRTPVKPFRYIGIKWFAVKTPTPLVSHRDYCCLEIQDKLVDAYGNEMFIRILSSIDVPECPSLENSHSFVRGKILSGFMYHLDRLERNLVRIHHVAHYDPCGYFPSQWSFKAAESQLISSVTQIQRVIARQQMNACTFVERAQWIPNSDRHYCIVCAKSFATLVRPRHHCRVCGEVICGKCSVFRDVDVPGTNLKSVRICSPCNVGVHGRPSQQTNKDYNIADANDETTSNKSESTNSVSSSHTVGQGEMNLMDLYMSTSNPGTPSAYSSASTQSNLSIRSTTSTRSARVDPRARHIIGGNHTFTNSNQSGYNLTNSNQSQRTPRSYINNKLTPRQLDSNNHFFPTTPRRDDVNRSSGRLTAEALAASAVQRMDSFKQNPLDLTYLSRSESLTSSKDSRNRTDSMLNDLPNGKKVARLASPNSEQMPSRDQDGDVNMGESSLPVTDLLDNHRKSGPHWGLPRVPYSDSSESQLVQVMSTKDRNNPTFFGLSLSNQLGVNNNNKKTSAATAS